MTLSQKQQDPGPFNPGIWTQMLVDRCHFELSLVYTSPSRPGLYTETPSQKGAFQLPATPVPGGLTSSSGTVGTGTHSAQTNINIHKATK